MAWMTWCAWMILILTTFLLVSFGEPVDTMQHVIGKVKLKVIIECWLMSMNDELLTSSVYTYLWCLMVFTVRLDEDLWNCNVSVSVLSQTHNVSSRSQTKCPMSQSYACRVLSQSWPERSHGHPWLIQQRLLAVECRVSGDDTAAEFRRISYIAQQNLAKFSGKMVALVICCSIRGSAN